MTAEKEFLEKVEAFGAEVLDRFPQLNYLIQAVHEAAMTSDEAVKRIWLLAESEPELRSSLEAALLSVFGLVPETSDIAQLPDRAQMLDRWGFDEEDLIYTPIPSRPNQKMLHPLLMGMIVELLQYDGDVPELRSGKLPEGGTAAVPVKTTARDPVMVGALLKRASQEVTAELEAAQREHDTKVTAMLEAIGSSPSAATGLVRQEAERGVGVEGYAPGKRAVARQMTHPDALDLAKLEFAERQDMAHTTLTSTQGRRSCVPAICDMILASLHAAGYTALREGEGGEPVAQVEWSMTIDGGRSERNPNFNFIDVAARSLSTKLQRALAAQASRFTRLRLHVTPFSKMADRRVGWSAVLFE